MLHLKIKNISVFLNITRYNDPRRIYKCHSDNEKKSSMVPEMVSEMKKRNERIPCWKDNQTSNELEIFEISIIHLNTFKFKLILWNKLMVKTFKFQKARKFNTTAEKVTAKSQRVDLLGRMWSRIF